MDARSFEDLRERLGDFLRQSPAQEIDRNLRALLAGWLDRMDVVLRDDFEVQRRLLEKAQAQIAQLEARLTELEKARR